jgi:proteasome lid subunit RPN8/RPN11
MSLALREELVAVCARDLPNESCGVAGGRPGEIARLYPLVNVAASPERYTVDPQEQMEVYRAMEDDGLECVAVYHSHPHTPARPSLTDIAEAYDPDVLYMIVSFAENAPSVRAFTIREGSVTEVAVETGASGDVGAELTKGTKTWQ